MSINKLTIARVLIIIAFLVSLISLSKTASHLWEPSYFLPALEEGPQHARFHFLREIMGDLGAMLTAIVILFSPERYRIKPMWWVLLIAIFFYYGAFWVGYPILGVGAPNIAAKTVHTLMTVFGFAGVFVARQEFNR